MAVITSGFGKRKPPCPTCSSDHKGIDLRAGVGSPIYANQDLKVSRVIDTGKLGYGKALYVKDPNDPSKEYVFGHLDDNNPGGYKVGQTIPSGSLMGYSGATGANEQPHVHYEVRKNGVPIDPKNDVGIASFEKGSGNLLTTTATVEKNRPGKPATATETAPPDSAINDIVKRREQEKNKTGPGSTKRPRPAKSDVGVLVNPLLKLGDN